MYTFYRKLKAAFIVVSAALMVLPLKAQITEEQQEQIEKDRKEAIAARTVRPRQLQPIKSGEFNISPPVVINFTQGALYNLAHPKPVQPFRDNEDHDELKFQPQAIQSGAVVTQIPSARGAGAGNTMKAGTTSPAPILNFNGILGDGSVIPPDIKIAIGTEYVMEVTNQSNAIYNKTTGALINTIDLSTFWNFTQNNSSFLSDPHILYDAIHGRFMACIDAIITGSPGTFLLAVSETSNPTGNWYIYSISEAGTAVTNGNSILLDFPIMGYNENWIVLTGNQFNGNNATTDQIYVMDRASAYSGTLGTIKYFSDANSYCVSPAQTMDTTTLTEYIVQDANGDDGGTGYVQVGTITGPVGTPVYSAGTQVGVTQPWNENSVEAPQEGSAGLIDNDDTRISTSEYLNGSLWFAHTVWLPATGTATSSAADWWQINCSNLAVTQFGRISAASTWYYYPNLYANARGDALVGYTVSSSSIYASAEYSFHAAADAANSMESPYGFKAGVASYAPTGTGANADNRWGDFSGAGVDPVDSSFWVADGWANTGDNWATQIAHVGSSVPNTVPPVANFQANVTTSCTGTIQFTDFSSNNPTSWLWNFGDGTTSTLQDPTHTYTTAGTFTVVLQATNAYGTGTSTQTSYITITEPTGPTATGASHCGGSTFSLSASTTNPVKWLDSAGTVVSTSNPFVTPVLNATTTYYVTDSILSAVDSVGAKSNTALGTGGYLTPNYGLNFNVLQNGLLQSVYVYAQAAGSVTIFIQNGSGVTLNTATVNVPAGGSRVQLNFPLTVGTGYYINYSSSIDLYRNNEGAVYPYNDAQGIVSITGNNATGAAAYYYFLYNWYVSLPNCNSVATPVTATVTQGVTLSSGTPTEPVCNGASTGSVTVTPVGGTPAYTYDWSNGQTTATLTNVIAGTYTVSVHDASGCSGTASETISQPAAIALTVSPGSVACFGTATGSDTAHAAGGTGTLSFHWSNGTTTAVIANLIAGTYPVTITDANSCSVTATSTVTQPSSALGVSVSEVNSGCGSPNGSVSASVSGGTTAYSYIWSSGATTASVTGLGANTYSLTVTDAKHCSVTSSTTISNSGLLNVSATPAVGNCGSGTGGASAVISGGTSPFTYSWSNGATTASISGVAANTYQVTATDNTGCSGTASVSVVISVAVSATASATPVSCFNGANGNASVSVTSGTSPYSYAWSNGSTVASLSNVIAGNYIVTITDAHSCQAIDTADVTQPGAITLFVTAVSPTCAGFSDGTASINATGGTLNYQYLWSNTQTGSSISGLAAGSYSITLTDAHQCSASSSFNITNPVPVTATALTTSDSCFNDNDGAISLTPAGGTSPYAYLWSNGATSASVNGLTAGSYSVTITDSHSCSGTSSAAVSQPSQIEVTTDSTDANQGQSNGSATVTQTTGGTSPYSYFWSNGQTTSTASHLATGTYTVTITDHNGCETTATVKVNMVLGIATVNAELAFSIYPNPAHTEVTVQTGNLDKETTLILRDILGQTLISKVITGNTNTLDLTSYADGIYFVELLQNGKQAVQKLVINR